MDRFCLEAWMPNGKDAASLVRRRSRSFCVGNDIPAMQVVNIRNPYELSRAGHTIEGGNPASRKVSSPRYK